MNKTFGDMMGEYTAAKDQARRFSQWDPLDKFVEELANHISPKDKKPFTHKYQEFSFDANGTETHE